MKKRQRDPYRGLTTKGIDVSRWQGLIKWDKVPNNDIKYVIVRTGDGHTVDTSFVYNWNESGKNDFTRGSYHYFRADRGGDEQLQLVLRLLDDVGGLLATDLPPCLDFEGGIVKNLPGGILGGTTDLPIGLVVEEALEFLQGLENELGVLPMVYTGQAFHWALSQAFPDLAAEFSKYPLWTPDYRAVPRVPANREGTKFPWTQWTFWQYTSKEKVPGIKTLVDANYFRGDETAFLDFVASLHDDQGDKISPSDDVYRTVLHQEMRELVVQLASVQAKLDSLPDSIT